MSDKTVEFNGSIEVRRWKQGGRGRVLLSTEGMEIELDLEEAAVLTYQLQKALVDLQELGVEK